MKYCEWNIFHPNYPVIVLFICVTLVLAGCTQNVTPPEPDIDKYGPEPARNVPSEKEGYEKPYYVLGKWYYPRKHARGFKQIGIASWYGKDFHGKPTSSGEIYDMNRISAAHKTLPLGTYVRIINLENNRSIDVRINDRGPFVDGRVIDLSYAAAKKLRIIGPGTAEVKIIALGRAETKETEFGKIRSYTPINFYKGEYSIQVGAFGSRENAEKLRKNLEKQYRFAEIAPVYDHKSGKIMYRVLVGKCSYLDQAEKYKAILKKKGFEHAFIIAKNGKKQ